MSPGALQWPALRGGLLALTAAVLFGVSTPLVQRLGVGIGSLTTAALLYAGAALVGMTMRRRIDREAQVQRRDAVRLGLMGIVRRGDRPRSHWPGACSRRAARAHL
jgi:hypothetical protein